MKKFLSLILAVAMVLTMASVSFAATSAYVNSSGTPKSGRETPEEVYDALKRDSYDGEDGWPINSTIIGPFGFENDDKALTLDDVQYGKTAYFLLTEYSDSGDPVRLVTDSDSAKNLKVKGDWEEGKSLVDGMAIVKKRVDKVGVYDDGDLIEADGSVTANAAGLEDMYDVLGDYGFVPNSRTYYYMIAVTIEDSTSTSDADIIGTLTLSKSKKPRCNDIEFDLEINVDWEESYRKDSVEWIIDGDREFKAETYYSLKFDGDDEVEFTFEDEDSTFTVDISGQGKLLFYYDIDFNSAIASKYPNAELNFWNGNGAKFNRTGELFLHVGENYDDAYLYQINSDGNLSEVSGAEFDDADEGFYLKTRTLGSYVFSDVELDLSASESTDDSDVVVTPVQPVTPVNPGTGAKA